MNQKEVRYDLYCEKCKHCSKTEEETPCDDCLSYPSNEDSHKPVRFETK